MQILTFLAGVLVGWFACWLYYLLDTVRWAARQPPSETEGGYYGYLSDPGRD